jgi:hypothetical protein
MYYDAQRLVDGVFCRIAGGGIRSVQDDSGFVFEARQRLNAAVRWWTFE